METNVGKGVIAGFAATVVLSALMVMKAKMGMMPEMNAIRMLTGMAHHFMGTPMTPMVGWLLHFMIGTVAWGALFALLANQIPGKSPAIKGILFGTAAWLLMMVMVMPMAGAGLFGLHLGMGAPVATLMLHWVFGAVLGGLYGKLTTAHHSPAHA
ncbi:MAG TPA: DUF6789 family protein [Mariprofundaceae bacterium]|nr:DUF6789 family protein [Mariprofundaceae bacterium]